MNISKPIYESRLDGPLGDSIGAILDGEDVGITTIRIDTAA